MSSAENHNLEFSSAESEVLTEYRPFSPLSIAAFVLGLLSPLALAHPVLWVVPLVAAVISLIALRESAVNAGEQRGRGLAVFGFACAFFFCSWAVSWYISYYSMLNSQARVRGEEWLDLVRQGHLYEAHQLTQDYSERLAVQDPIDEIYTDPRYIDQVAPALKRRELSEMGEILDPATVRSALPGASGDFTASEPVKTLFSLDDDFRFRFDETVERIHYNNYQSDFRLLYTVLYEQDGQTQSLPMIVVVSRDRVDNNAYWSISSVLPPT